MNSSTPTHSLQMSTNQSYNSSGPLQSIQAPAMPSATSSSRSKTRALQGQGSIAAGAEDLKYATKYRDLKRKVREIEADNDRLLYKILQSKRNIQRAKLERAILYERLGSLPATPPPTNAQLPQQVPPPGNPQAPSLQHHGRAEQPPPASGRRSYNKQAPPSHHYQQPIQPAPAPPHVSPPQHHAQAHAIQNNHSHHPRDSSHPGQLPITHEQQFTTVSTHDGPILVVAGPDGRPVYTADRGYIPAHSVEQHSAPEHTTISRKRSGRERKDVRDTRDRDAREREGIQHIAPLPSRERERERERERDHQVVNHHSRDHGQGIANVHGHRYHSHQTADQTPAQSTTGGQAISPIQNSPPNAHAPAPEQLHRSHSHASQYSSSSHGASTQSHHTHHHHRHGHSHSHSHSGSPHSPESGRGTASSYPSQRHHAHQRVGPGSYSLRDRAAERDRELEEEQARAVEATSGSGPAGSEPSASTPPQSSQPNSGPPAQGSAPASTARVPTPPYTQLRDYGRDGVNVLEPTLKTEMGEGDGYGSDDGRPITQDRHFRRSVSPSAAN